MSAFTSEQVEAAAKLMAVVVDTIRDAGEIPSGHLYAALMSAGCTLSTYEQLIGVLERRGLIEVDPSHVIRWIGPKKAETA